MMGEDDKRFYELSSKQARNIFGKWRLDKLPERVYDRDVRLKKEQNSLLTIEEKYEIEFIMNSILDEKKEAKA